MKLKSFLPALLVICALALSPYFVSAQGNPGPDPDPVDVPFDGGLSLLVAAGIGIGAKKAYDRKKKLEQQKRSDKGL